MAKIAFIGLGNMGGPMAANLVKGQHQVMAFDLSAAALDAAVAKGAKKVASAGEAVTGAEVVVTMLPAGKHVREVYEKDVLPNVAKGTLLIDCSTIDVDSARNVGQLAQQAGLEMVDAPVSGGVGGATAGTLTFMVGGSDAAFAKARPILEKMGKNIVHTGAVGAGQFLDDAEIIDRGQFRTAERAGEPQREQAGLGHLPDQRRRQTAVALDLAALGPDGRRQRPRRGDETFGISRADACGHQRLRSPASVAGHDARYPVRIVGRCVAAPDYMQIRPD